VKCDVRVVAAANRELRELVAEGTFRADLFYRLNIIRVHLPPLRERRADLPLLIDHYLRMYAQRYERGELTMEPASLRQLLDYEYPGNVRELETIVHRATLLSEGPLVSVDGLLESNIKPDADAMPPGGDEGDSSFHLAKARVVERFERDYLTAALQRSRGVITEAAKAVGLSERNFHVKLRKYGLAHEALADLSAHG
jgi:DNA-binding NtrC family response regulator